MGFMTAMKTQWVQRLRFVYKIAFSLLLALMDLLWQ